jgi:hypothetical protein
MTNDIEVTFSAFLREIGLGGRDFTRQSFGEFREWYRSLSDQKNATYGEIRHAYTAARDSLYTPAALEAARHVFGRLVKGHSDAAEDLLGILDGSRPQICQYLYTACQSGRISRRVLGAAISYLIDLGDVIGSLKQAGLSEEEIAEMFEEAGPRHIMSLAEREALQMLPSVLEVRRPDKGRALASVAREMSWTLCQGVANRHAKHCSRLVPQRNRGWHGAVAREDILACLGDRDDGEVIVRSGRVRQLVRDVRCAPAGSDRSNQLPSR